MDSSSFYLDPGDPDLFDFAAEPEAITITRVGGETLALDPRRFPFTLTEERPQVDRMAGDLGAICEVFRQNRYYYAAVAGVPLSAGDVITLRYPSHASPVILLVMELENGRARVDLSGFRQGWQTG